MQNLTRVYEVRKMYCLLELFSLTKLKDDSTHFPLIAILIEHGLRHRLGSGGGQRENLAPTTKDLVKSYIVLQKSRGLCRRPCSMDAF